MPLDTDTPDRLEELLHLHKYEDRNTNGIGNPRLVKVPDAENNIAHVEE